jgi:hypothetical protein
MKEHPAESRRELTLGVVTDVHPDTWEVDVRLQNSTSSTIRAKIASHFLPEVHEIGSDGKTPVPGRQSKVFVWRVDAYSQGAIAIPMHHLIAGLEQLGAHVFWSEHLNFRITINRQGTLEIRNAKDGGPLLQVRMIEEDGVIRLDTPKTHVALKDADGSVAVQCDGDLSAEVGGDLTVQVQGKADATVVGDVTLTTPSNLIATVIGNATFTVAGNVTVTATGQVAVSGARIDLN